MTKNEIIKEIKNILGGAELCVKEFERTLRNGRWGYHCYAIKCEGNELWAMPYAKADVKWRARLEDKLSKSELQYILDKAKRFLTK